jgi:DNA modification methylase
MYAASLPFIYEFSKEDAALYLCFASLLSLSVFGAVKENNYICRSVIVWNKNLAQFGAFSAQYHQKHKTILYCHKAGKTPFWSGKKNEVSVWDIDRKSANEYHSTEKPVELVSRAINNSAPDGCILFEPFCGSGSTMVACQNLGRKCRAIEISPAYCSVILERMSTAFPGIEIKRLE